MSGFYLELFELKTEQGCWCIDVSQVGNCGWQWILRFRADTYEREVYRSEGMGYAPALKKGLAYLESISLRVGGGRAGDIKFLARPYLRGKATWNDPAEEGDEHIRYRGGVEISRPLGMLPKSGHLSVVLSNEEHPTLVKTRIGKGIKLKTVKEFLSFVNGKRGSLTRIQLLSCLLSLLLGDDKDCLLKDPLGTKEERLLVENALAHELQVKNGIQQPRTRI